MIQASYAHLAPKKIRTSGTNLFNLPLAEDEMDSDYTMSTLPQSNPYNMFLHETWKSIPTQLAAMGYQGGAGSKLSLSPLGVSKFINDIWNLQKPRYKDDAVFKCLAKKEKEIIKNISYERSSPEELVRLKITRGQAWLQVIQLPIPAVMRIVGAIIRNAKDQSIYSKDKHAPCQRRSTRLVRNSPVTVCCTQHRPMTGALRFPSTLQEEKARTR